MDISVQVPVPGGPECLQVAPHTPAPPGPGEIRLRHSAIGVGFIDVYHRTGLYPLPAPSIPGVEGVGIVEEVGAGVSDLRPGDRVAYAGGSGAYASTRLLPAWRAIPMPDAIPDTMAATSMLRGLTAHMLLTVTYSVGPDSVVLIHAAAGGLGQVLTLWAKRLGATVIGTVGHEEKGSVARANGVDHIIVGRDAPLVEQVSDLTNGRGADYVIDGIGGTMPMISLRCVRPLGTVALIGWVSGPVPPIRVEDMGTATLAKPSVMAYASDPDRYRDAARMVVQGFCNGLSPDAVATYPLSDASVAHAALESGRTVGSLCLLP